MRKILAAAVLAILLISFSGRDNLPRLYADAAAVTSGVEGEKLEKCLEGHQGVKKVLHEILPTYHIS